MHWNGMRRTTNIGLWVGDSRGDSRGETGKFSRILEVITHKSTNRPSIKYIQKFFFHLKLRLSSSYTSDVSIDVKKTLKTHHLKFHSYKKKFQQFFFNEKDANVIKMLVNNVFCSRRQHLFGFDFRTAG